MYPIVYLKSHTSEREFETQKFLRNLPYRPRYTRQNSKFARAQREQPEEREVSLELLLVPEMLKLDIVPALVLRDLNIPIIGVLSDVLHTA